MTASVNTPNPLSLQGDAFTLRQLVELSGVPAPSIHQYRRMGLLPEPRQRAANLFLYDARHVTALRMIRELRDRNGLRLETIHKILPALLDYGEALLGSAEWDEVVATQIREW